jgi:hypothetical protein
LFSEKDLKIVEELLLERSTNEIFGSSNWTEENFERIWVSVLNLSDGNFGKLLDAIELAHTDYRDLFMSAGFGYDSHAHLRWHP